MRRAAMRSLWLAVLLAVPVATAPACSPVTPAGVATAPHDGAPHAPLAPSAGVQAGAASPGAGTGLVTTFPEGAPPPLTGGTLLMLAGGGVAVAADPERDQLYVVDLAGQVRFTVPLEAGDQPARLVEDRVGHVHVALRRGGVVVTLDPTSGAITARRPACAAPRGIAFDAATDDLYVACAGGELVTLPAAGGPATRTLHFDLDLRDVVVDGGSLVLTRFRTADVLRVNAAGDLVGQGVPADFEQAAPTLAWRAVPVPGGGVLIAHQYASNLNVATKQPGSYGVGSCGSIVCAAIAFVGAGALPWAGSTILTGAPLPIDLAVSGDGQQVALIASGNAALSDPQVFVNPAADFQGQPQVLPKSAASFFPPGQAIAVAFTPDGTLWAQTREPAALQRFGYGQQVTIPLATDSRYDRGHAIFHGATQAGLACASCHGEGGDDGHLWSFDIGPRRTPAIRGGILGTEPFHWGGDEANMGALVEDVFTQRMDGPTLPASDVAALSAWVEALPALPLPIPQLPLAALRGAALFVDPDVGCSGCHSGPHLTNNLTLDVGTGGAFQVPSLHGVAFRPPYLHDGCAVTLQGRFNPDCGGGDQHGHTSQLTPTQIDDLIAYLQTL